MATSNESRDLPTLSPYLTVADSEKSIEFYKNAFGFTLAEPPAKEGGKIVHVHMKCRDASVMFSSEEALKIMGGELRKAPKTSGEEPCCVSMYAYVPDVDQFFKHAKEQGAIVLQKPEDTFWGDRWCKLKDLNGYDWAFATHTGKTEPAEK